MGFEGVTTAIAMFVLAGLAFPHIIKKRSLYYAAVGMLLLMILLDAVAYMINGSAVPKPEGSGILVFRHVAVGFLQAFSILALVMSAGGLTPKEMAGEMKDAYEVIRRGEEEKEIIIPLHKQAGAEQLRVQTTPVKPTPRADTAAIPLDE
jgi:hypothetical protein